MNSGDSGIERQKRQDPGIEKLIRSDLSHLKAYQSIIPPDVLSKRAGIPVERVIKLDGNENPYGCSPRVGRALAEVQVAAQEGGIGGLHAGKQP